MEKTTEPFDFGEGGIGLWVPLVIDYKDNRERPEETQLSCEIRRVRTIDQMARANETDEMLFRWRKKNLEKWLKDTVYAEQIRSMGPDILRGYKQFVEHTRAFKNFYFDGELVTDPYEIFLRLPIPRAAQTQATLINVDEVLSLVVGGGVDDLADIKDIARLGVAELNEQVEFFEQIEDVESGDEEAFETLQTVAQALKIRRAPGAMGITHSIQEAIRDTAGLTGDELKNFVWECAGNSSAITPAPMASPTVSPALEEGTHKEPVGT